MRNNQTTERLFILSVGMIAGLFIALFADAHGWLNSDTMMWFYVSNALIVAVLGTAWLNSR